MTIKQLPNFSYLENELLNQNVSQEHINRIKKEKLKSGLHLWDICDKSNPREVIEDVPVQKIKGIDTARGEAKVTWFKNLQHYKDYNYDHAKVLHFWNQLCDLGITQFHKTFEDPNNSGEMKFLYFEGADEYYTESGGSHRTLFARVTGASTMKSCNVTILKMDPAKYKNYSMVKKTKQEIFSLIEQLSLTLHIESKVGHDDKLVVLYKDQKIFNQISPPIRDYSNENTINQHLAALEGVREILMDLHRKYKQIRRKKKFLRGLSITNYKYKDELNRLIDYGWQVD
ncbi:hypothetical protein [Rossellomorea marisflavi]|uniref:hypothetical protein n=1 Tax=Rossellomorea marisflavi TaxID=189381 RepID=UPI00345ACB2F